MFVFRVRKVYPHEAREAATESASLIAELASFHITTQERGSNYYIVDWYHLSYSSEIDTRKPTASTAPKGFVSEVGRSVGWSLGRGRTESLIIFQRITRGGCSRRPRRPSVRLWAESYAERMSIWLDSDSVSQCSELTPVAAAAPSSDAGGICRSSPLMSSLNIFIGERSENALKWRRIDRWTFRSTNCMRNRNK